MASDLEEVSKQFEIAVPVLWIVTHKVVISILKVIPAKEKKLINKSVPGRGIVRQKEEMTQNYSEKCFIYFLRTVHGKNKKG